VTGADRSHPSDAELAASLVEEAGQLARRMRADGLHAEQKTSVSDIVTAADRAAERLVVDGLVAARPDDAIVGEEGTEHDGTSGRTWVIDPVDGTYNFHRGLEWWCSALALAVDDEPVLGAVHHPQHAVTYLGGPSLPGTRAGEPLAPLVDRPLAHSCVATYLHPPFVSGVVGAAFGRAVSGAASVRMLGSGTMDAMAIAEGRLDALCQHSVPDWDRLPGAAIIRSVGGESRRTTAAGVVWHVAGVPTAVAEICAALEAG
jgi:fructose-1,6-bisphosphatase/inositol monophosphatase family enzyme